MLKLGDGWLLFWDSFDNIGLPSFLDWYSVSDWRYTGVGSLSSCSFFLSCSLSCSMLITSDIFLIKGLSESKISLH